MDTTNQRVATRSPVALARKALQVARQAIPAYSSKFSKKDFTQHQLLALLALGQFLKTDDRGIVALLGDWSDLRRILGLKKKLPHPTTLFQARKRLAKGALEGLLCSVFRDAHRRGLIDPRPQAAIDSTGLEASVRSAHYARRRRDGNRRYRKRKHPKLTIVCHTASHLIASALSTVGPSYDVDQFEPAMLRASWNLQIDRLLADAGYDSEPNHRMAREGLAIRSTVIRLNRRGRFRAKTGGRRRLPSGRYRRQMARRFHRRKYGQRWQVESVISRIKRRLGAALRGRSDAARQRESDLRVFTHNLMILAGSAP